MTRYKKGRDYRKEPIYLFVLAIAGVAQEREPNF